MADSHEFIKRVLGEAINANPNPTHFHWQQILSSLNEVIAHHSSESEAVLRAILEYDGPVPINGSASSHSLSPEDMMRSIAIQTLAKWDKDKHKDLIEKVAKKTDSHLLAAIANAQLK
jgi:hypothetical protein